METLLKQLQSILDRILLFQDQLLSFAQKMNDAIVGREIDMIQKYTAQYDETTLHVEELEEKRLALCEEIGRQANFAGRSMKMRDIISIASPALRDCFVEQHKKLKEKVCLLTRLNTANKVLLEQNLENVTFNVELRFSSMNDSGGYKRGGTRETSVHRRNMVNHTA